MSSTSNDDTSILSSLSTSLLSTRHTISAKYPKSNNQQPCLQSIETEYRTMEGELASMDSLGSEIRAEATQNLKRGASILDQEGPGRVVMSHPQCTLEERFAAAKAGREYPQDASNAKRRRIEHAASCDCPPGGLQDDGTGRVPESEDEIKLAEQAREERRKDLRGMWHTKFQKMFAETIDSLIHAIKTGKEDEAIKLAESCAEFNSVWALKYENLKPKKKERKIQGKHPETAEKINAMFQGEEESKHPWATSMITLPGNGLLMRVSDERSKAKTYRGDLFAAGMNAELNTFAGRKESLLDHLTWRPSQATVFVSTCSNIKDFCDIWITKILEREERRPSLKSAMLIFINGNARLAAGFPILSASRENKHYQAREHAAFLESEYLLPLFVPKEQIVGTYCWSSVEKYISERNTSYLHWHNAVPVPAFREHEAARLEGRSVRGGVGCVCCRNALSSHT